LRRTAAPPVRPAGTGSRRPAERRAHRRDAGCGGARRRALAAAPFLVGQLTLDKDALSCAVIVDAGFSFLTAVVVLDGFPVHCTAKRCAEWGGGPAAAGLGRRAHRMRDAAERGAARCRCQVGGKLLTNHLKEIVSYRYASPPGAMPTARSPRSRATGAVLLRGTVQAMEHDGRDLHHEPRERAVLLRVLGSPARPGRRPVGARWVAAADGFAGNPKHRPSF